MALFNVWYWNIWVSIRKKSNLDPYLTRHAKFKLKWMKSINVKVKNYKISEIKCKRK